MDDLEKVIRGNLQDADQRILDRLGHVAEATLVVSTVEDMNCCEWHVKVSLSWTLLSRRRLNGCRDAPKRHDARAVHHHIDPAERVPRLFEEALHVGGVRHIGLHGDGLPT